MGKIIAVVSGKGGTGKTSFTASVGICLANGGAKVLCLDCDIALRNLDLALGLSDRAIMDFNDVIMGRCTLEEAVVPHEKYSSVHLLAAPLSNGDLSITTKQMMALGDAIREVYDYCLVDAPAGFTQGFRWAVAMADRVVVVTTTDPSSLRDAQRTVQELQHFPNGRLHLVVNRVQKKLLKAMRTNIDDAIDTAGLPLLGVIPEDEDVSHILGRGLPLRDNNYYSAIAYENIAKRLRGQHTPLMKL